MRICGSCGLDAEKEHAFCSRCGGPLVSASAPLPKVPGPVASEGGAQRFAGTQMMPSAAPRLTTARFRLTVTRPDGSTGTSLLMDDTVIAGSQGDILLEADPFAAEEHACFALHDGVVEVTDLPESGGTWLGLAPGAQVRVPPAGRLRLGSQVLEISPTAVLDTSKPSAWGSPDLASRVRVLQLLEGGEAGAAWLLPEGVFTVGREGSTITISEDGFLSGRHGKLEVGADGTVTYEDLCSSNGSFLGIEQTTRLEAGDRLFLGQHLIWVEHA